jgi:membrane protein DedA with SNARE-associated domain/membrane-associated phospholipid phosphatase
VTKKRIALALLVVAAVAVYASGVLPELPDPKKVIGDIAQALGPWTYALVGGLAFLETGAFVGLVAPGETVVIAGGVIAGQGEIDLTPLIGLVWACAILGDTTSFFLGRRLGRPFMERHGPKLKITPQRLDQVEGYFERHGGKTILIGRFIGLVRALAPFIAGSSGLPYRRFIPFSVVGTGLWATVFCVLGYVFWQSFDQVAKIAGRAVFAFGLVVGAVVAVVVAYRRRREIRRWIERHEESRWLRPLLAAFRPAWRAVAPRALFLWRRLTPGGLGLELTTALAVAGVGLYFFVLYTVMLAGDPGQTPLDSELLTLSNDLHTGTLVDVAKLVTDLGAFPVVAALVLLTGGLLVARRRVAEAVTLVLGLVLLYIAVQETKAGIDRPRPERPAVAASKSSFPSGHAAYSTAWVAVAVSTTRMLGIAGRAALVVGAIAVSAAVGATRMYLRVHFFSDVAGGWGLGFGIFATLAAITLIVTHIRHNGARSEPERAPAAMR